MSKKDLILTTTINGANTVSTSCNISKAFREKNILYQCIAAFRNRHGHFAAMTRRDDSIYLHLFALGLWDQMILVEKRHSLVLFKVRPLIQKEFFLVLLIEEMKQLSEIKLHKIVIATIQGRVNASKDSISVFLDYLLEIGFLTHRTILELILKLMDINVIDFRKSLNKSISKAIVLLGTYLTHKELIESKKAIEVFDSYKLAFTFSE